MAKHAVRIRRAYFDCRFGQLHVRTAFPTTGGFDEGVSLFCLHPQNTSSRVFDRFLPEIATDRSVFAPDLPGFGESDAAEIMDFQHLAEAIADLAAGLRMRQIDLLGFRYGAGVALALSASHPQLVRRLVLVAAPLMDRLPEVDQDSLVIRIELEPGEHPQWSHGTLRKATFVHLAGHAADLFDAAPEKLAKQISDFLKATS